MQQCLPYDPPWQRPVRSPGCSRPNERPQPRGPSRVDPHQGLRGPTEVATPVGRVR
jgi:hypothetical protein